jgi:uncharacterized protein
MTAHRTPGRTQEEALDALRRILGEMRRVLLAYSGGVDSAFLLKVAADVLPGRVLAVTGLSPTYPQSEYESACKIASALGVEHVSIQTDELEDPAFSSNPPDRCYHCKRELFRKLRCIADARGIEFVLDANNSDDCLDYRPGRRAASEAGVRSPLIEAGLTKNDVRRLSRLMGLPTWDKPASACLASRFPYGETITAGKLRRVEQAEAFLRKLGFGQVRMRCHGELVRIEVDPDRVHELTRTGEARERIINELRVLGFVFVTVDLEGYRTGSLNETLPRAAERGAEPGEKALEA